MSAPKLKSDLLNFMLTQGYQPGDRLPTISELASDAYLGISASKVREQLEVARALGLVEVRSKTGTRLKAYSFKDPVRLSLFYAMACDGHHFEHFAVLRKHIEAAFWQEACALLTADDLGQMRQCIVDARRKLNATPIHLPHAEHRRFHLKVFERLDNPFVLGLLEAYWDAYDAIESRRYADYRYHTQVWDYHERILNAIEAGDFDAAREAFLEHTALLRHDVLPTSDDHVTEGK